MASTIRRLYGRNCEAGWGYDAENGVFISNPGLTLHCHLKPMPNYKVLVISQDEIETVQNQLFQLYQKRKLLDKELDLLDSSSNLKKSSNEVKKMKKRVELFKYEKLWDLKMKQCSKLLQGSKLTDFELNFDSAFNELLEIKCELQTATVAKTIDPELICNSQFDEPFGRKIQSESIAEKIGAQLCSIDQIIIMDKDYFYLLDPEMAKKFKMGVFLSNEDDEPFISNKNLDKKILIGFASHKNRFTSDELETSEMFVTRCPEKCTRDDRQWICITCGNFFKAKNFEVVCDCGTTHVTNLKL
uniref:Uncharacterized protein n=1 Tax=Panagrolaimus sp. JU765 TaxID=591449 RepID=A0AC34RCE3_9BILA